MKYRKKPIIIEAVQWTGDTRDIDEILKMGASRSVSYSNQVDYLEIDTLEGVMKANIGDWIIKGAKDELYPCKPDIFEMTYEKVKE